MKKEILSSRWMLILLLLGLCATACKKDKQQSENLKNADEKSFVPRVNKKYTYSIIEEGVNVGSATKWIDGVKDSAGIQVYNLHTNIAAHGFDLGLNNKMYVQDGKTYVSLDMPDAWYLLVEELKRTPNTVVNEAKHTGFTGYMAMENAIRENSKLTWILPTTTSQYISFTRTYSGSSTTIEVWQELFQNNGQSVAVETITVPAGTFVCNKFVYTSNQTQTIKNDNVTVLSGDGSETVTLWMAHGVGVVKQEIFTILNGSMSNSSVVLNNIQS